MKDGVLLTIEEAKSQEILRLKEDLLALDGRAIALRGAQLGQSLFLTATRFTYPFAEFSPTAIEHSRMEEDDSILLISTHSDRNPVSDPVGFIDWRLQGDMATVSGCHLGHREIFSNAESSIMKENFENDVLSNWIALEAFYVDEKARRRGVGSLLIASSLVALKSLHIKAFRIGRATLSAQGAWKKFGVANTAFGVELPLGDAVQSPRVNEILSQFV